MAKISTPNAMAARRLGAAAMAKQLQIATIDEGKAAFYEGDDGIAQRRCLPRLGVDAGRAVDRDGDLAIGRAVHATIGGAEFEAKAAALFNSHARVAQWRTLEPGAREACQRVDTIKEVVIERDDRCKLIVWECARKKENLEIMIGKTGIRSFRAVTPRDESLGEAV